MALGGSYPNPKGLDSKRLHRARIDREFVNPPGYDQFGSFFDSNHGHGEFPSMQKVTGRRQAEEHRKNSRDRYPGLGEAQLSIKGRPF